MEIYRERIEKVREMMISKGWDAIVLTGSDPHGSEYSAPRWHQVEWVCGFTGEGDLVVTADHCGVWTDSRYFILASKELPATGTVLHKTRVPDEVPLSEWIAGHFAADEEVTIAVDGLSHSSMGVAAIESALGDRGVVVNAPDLLDSLWKDRPEIPASPIITLGTEQVGRSRTQKLSCLRNWLSDNDCDAILLTALDEIAWLLNVRGQDVAFNPVVMSYLLVTQDSAIWFVRKGVAGEEEGETKESFRELVHEGVSIQDYADVSSALMQMVDGDYISRIFVDPSTLNHEVYSVLAETPGGVSIVKGNSPVVLAKAVKNQVEIEGMREAHLEDGIAMTCFLYWLETTVRSGAVINEYEALEHLHELRSRIPGFKGESFETISAYGPNAASPHFVTPVVGSAELLPQGLYLCDSGGQYLFGTTDITRTVPLGPCSLLEREDYTLVLKGHIDLAKAVFPEGTAGCQIDALARAPLWNSKRNFGHGTGHGIGFYLNVHEGPQQIRQNFNAQPLLTGMITSNEPGIYREDQYGIRHENLVLTVPAGKNDFGDWLCFETLTLCHFDTSIIMKELLDSSEIEWLNAYNAKVFTALSPRLPSDVVSWLREKTRPI